MLLLLMNCEEFWEILPLMLYIPLEGTDTSDNEAPLIVDEKDWFYAVDRMLVSTGDATTILVLLAWTSSLFGL